MKRHILIILVIIFASLFVVYSLTTYTELQKQPINRSVEQNEIFQNLQMKANKDGFVRVIVGLKISTGDLVAEGYLSPDKVTAQRRAIKEAQDNVLKELSGTEYEVGRLFDTIPAMGLSVGSEALEKLYQSSYVKNFGEDIAMGIA